MGCTQLFKIAHFLKRQGGWFQIGRSSEGRLFDGSGHDPFCANCQSKGANLSVSQEGTGTLFARCCPPCSCQNPQTTPLGWKASSSGSAQVGESPNIPFLSTSLRLGNGEWGCEQL